MPQDDHARQERRCRICGRILPVTAFNDAELLQSLRETCRGCLGGSLGGGSTAPASGPAGSALAAIDAAIEAAKQQRAALGEADSRRERQAQERRETLREIRKALPMIPGALRLGVSWAVLGWMLVGFGGCFLRIFSPMARGNPNYPLHAYTEEAVFALVIGFLGGVVNTMKEIQKK
jgi:hypothetical protein